MTTSSGNVVCLWCEDKFQPSEYNCEYCSNVQKHPFSQAVPLFTLKEYQHILFTRHEYGKQKEMSAVRER